VPGWQTNTRGQTRSRWIPRTGRQIQPTRLTPTSPIHATSWGIEARYVRTRRVLMLGVASVAAFSDGHRSKAGRVRRTPNSTRRPRRPGANAGPREEHASRYEACRITRSNPTRAGRLCGRMRWARQRRFGDRSRGAIRAHPTARMLVTPRRPSATRSLPCGDCNVFADESARCRVPKVDHIMNNLEGEHSAVWRDVLKTRHRHHPLTRRDAAPRSMRDLYIDLSRALSRPDQGQVHSKMNSPTRDIIRRRPEGEAPQCAPHKQAVSINGASCVRYPSRGSEPYIAGEAQTNRHSCRSRACEMH
jgi:hypothetical protein